MELMHLSKKLGIDFQESDSFFYRGVKTTVLITGPGLALTSFQMGKMLSLHKFDLLIQAGICGSFSKDLKIGQVVRVEEEIFGDFGVDGISGFQSVFDAGILAMDFFPFENERIKIPLPERFTFWKSLPGVSGLTMNTVSGNAEKIKLVQKKFNPDIETMEGAGFAFAAVSFGFPAVQVRAVSNFVEARNKENWNISLATENLAQAIFDFYQTI